MTGDEPESAPVRTEKETDGERERQVGRLDGRWILSCRVGRVRRSKEDAEKIKNKRLLLRLQNCNYFPARTRATVILLKGVFCSNVFTQTRSKSQTRQLPDREGL
jgi:hypothetical protein